VERLMNHKSSLNRSIFTVVGGNIIAQGLIFVSSPILTRLYSPEAFGQLTVFISILAIINVVTSLKYELALPIERDEKQFLNLLVLSFLILFVTTLICAVAVYVVGFFLPKEFDGLILWLMPLAFLGEGLTAIATYYSIRKAEYKGLAIMKINKSIFSVGGQIGFYRLHSLGLFVGDVLGRILGGSKVYIMILGEIRQAASIITMKSIKSVAKKYKKFPLITSFSSLINSAGLQLTPILLSGLYGHAEVGLFALAQRVIVSPLSIIGRAVADVFYGTAAKMASPKELRYLFIKTSLKLMVVGIIPIGTLYIVGEKIFAVVFGSQWKETAAIIKVLSIMYLTQFVVSPLSQTLNIINKQGLQLTWDILRLILTVLPFMYGFFYTMDFYQTIQLFGIFSTISYILLYLLILKSLNSEIVD
jgi:lipopolysaccharide exporter